MKKTIVMLFFSVLSASLCETSSVFARHDHPERHYQEIWCANHSGRMEVVLQDGSRCDCVTATHAVEFDFAIKWAEAIGQALLYSVLTGKRAGIVLILEDAQDAVYLERIRRVVEFNQLPVDIWKIE